MAGFFDNLRKMNELRQKAKKIQNSLSELEIPYENGGLRVVARGDMTIKALEFLNPEILTPDNAAKLQRLFLDNTNKALHLAKNAAEAKMKEVAGGLDLGSLLGGN